MSIRSARHVAFAAAIAITACGHSGLDTMELTLTAPGAIRNTLTEFSGNKKEALWLKRHVRVVIETASDPRRATSRVHVSALAANFGAAKKRVSLLVSAPIGATFEHAASTPVTVATSDAAAIDPESTCYRVSAELAPGAYVEFVGRYTVKGTLASDTRWISSPDTPTSELLLSYRFPSDAVGAFGLVNYQGRPIVTRKDGDRLIALMVRNVPAASGNKSGYARYATKRARPRGYEQRYASSWSQILAPYAREFSERTVALRGASVPPFSPSKRGTEAVIELATWTRDRIQRTDAEQGRWNQGRILTKIIPTNDLYAVDKIHLLHWLLDAAGLKHQVGVARSSRFAPMGTDIPIPGAFDQALIYHDGTWFDPACRDCEPGQVRKSLQGQPAMLLGTDSPEFLELPR